MTWEETGGSWGGLGKNRKVLWQRWGRSQAPCQSACKVLLSLFTHEVGEQIPREESKRSKSYGIRWNAEATRKYMCSHTHGTVLWSALVCSSGNGHFITVVLDHTTPEVTHLGSHPAQSESRRRDQESSGFTPFLLPISNYNTFPKLGCVHMRYWP